MKPFANTADFESWWPGRLYGPFSILAVGGSRVTFSLNAMQRNWWPMSATKYFIEPPIPNAHLFDHLYAAAPALGGSPHA